MKQTNIKHTFNLSIAKRYKSIIRLFAAHFIRSFWGPFFVFFFPLILLAVLGGLNSGSIPLPNGKHMGMINIVFPGILATSISSISINSLPITLVDYKSSTIIKRIATTPLKKSDFLICILIWHLSVVILCILWLCFLVGFMFHSPTHGFSWSVVSIGKLILGLLIYMLMAITIGIAVATFSKNVRVANVIAFFFYFFPSFLSGQFIPLNVIDGNKILHIISMIFPFRYATDILYNACTAYVPSISSPAHNISLPWPSHWYDYFVPLITSFVVMIICIFRFKWEN